MIIVWRCRNYNGVENYLRNWKSLDIFSQTYLEKHGCACVCLCVCVCMCVNRLEVFKRLEETMNYAQGNALIITEHHSHQGSMASIFMLYLLMCLLNWTPIKMKEKCIVCELQTLCCINLKCLFLSTMPHTQYKLWLTHYLKMTSLQPGNIYLP